MYFFVKILLYYQQNERISKYRESDEARIAEGQFITNYAMRLREINLLHGQRLRVKKAPGLINTYFVHRQRGVKRGATGRDHELGLSQDEQRVSFDITKDICNCSCREWNDIGIACKHIMAVLVYLKLNGLLMNPAKAHLFYHKCYLMSNLQEMYKHSIEPIWGVPLRKDNTLGPIIHGKCALGKRIRSSHNRHQSIATGRLLQGKSCAICKSKLHTKRKCPLKDLSEYDRKRCLSDLFNTTSTLIGKNKSSSSSNNDIAAFWKKVKFYRQDLSSSLEDEEEDEEETIDGENNDDDVVEEDAESEEDDTDDGDSGSSEKDDDDDGDRVEYYEDDVEDNTTVVPSSSSNPSTTTTAISSSWYDTIVNSFLAFRMNRRELHTSTSSASTI